MPELPPQSKRPFGSRLGQAWRTVRELWRPGQVNIDEAKLQLLREKAETPVFWLFGKTQSGKTSIIRYLTGASDAEIGSGFRPCTTTSRIYPFPTEDAPVLTILDTRGVEEPSYDPTDDIAAFDARAHMVVVTLRLRDFAHGSIRESLVKIRATNRHRPVLLVLTCIHEAYPRKQHPDGPLGEGYEDAVRLIGEQTLQFTGLVDRVVSVDLTKEEEGFTNTEYGGPELKQALLELLPAAYRQTLMRLDDQTGELREMHLQRAVPVLIGYSSLAAAAGALPIPFIDLLIIPGIQAKLIHALAVQSGQPENARRFMELSASLGLGLLARQALREVAKFIPYVGSVVGGGLAYASTYALGRAYLAYQQHLHEGHAPDAAQLRTLYREQLASAEAQWKRGRK